MRYEPPEAVRRGVTPESRPGKGPWEPTELEVETIINKMREGRLRWFGYVRRRPQSTPVRRVEALVVDGVRRKVRRRDKPKLRSVEHALVKGPIGGHGLK
ncbi:hypothetical protein Tco_0457757 [Tanacetum coccineum]